MSARRGGGHFLVSPAARSGRWAAPGRGGAGRGRECASPSARVRQSCRRGWAQVLGGAAPRTGPQGARFAGCRWRGVRSALRASSSGSAAPGSAMAKPPPKPVKPGKGGAAGAPAASVPCELSVPLGRTDPARARPGASLERSLLAWLRSRKGRGIVLESERISKIFFFKKCILQGVSPSVLQY